METYITAIIFIQFLDFNVASEFRWIFYYCDTTETRHNRKQF